MFWLAFGFMYVRWVDFAYFSVCVLGCRMWVVGLAVGSGWRLRVGFGLGLY